MRHHLHELKDLLPAGDEARAQHVVHAEGLGGRGGRRGGGIRRVGKLLPQLQVVPDEPVAVVGYAQAVGGLAAGGGGKVGADPGGQPGARVRALGQQRPAQRAQCFWSLTRPNVSGALPGPMFLPYQPQCFWSLARPNFSALPGPMFLSLARPHVSAALSGPMFLKPCQAQCFWSLTRPNVSGALPGPKFLPYQAQCFWSLARPNVSALPGPMFL